MAYREVQLTIISAQDLKDVSTFGKMTPYAVASVGPRIKVATPIDRKGGVNPTWDAELKMIVDEQILNKPNAEVRIDIDNHGYLFKKHVGSCSVPLSHLKEVESKGANGELLMCAQVYRPSGRRQGTLVLSLKLGHVYQRPAMPARVPQTVEGNPNGYNQAGGNQYPQYRPRYAPQHPQAYTPGMGPPASYHLPAGPNAVPPPQRTGLLGDGILRDLLSGLALGLRLDEFNDAFGGGGFGGGGCGA